MLDKPKKECYNMNKLKDLLLFVKQKWCKHKFEYSITPLSFGLLEGIQHKKCLKCGYEDYDMEAVTLKLTNIYKKGE